MAKRVSSFNNMLYWVFITALIGIMGILNISSGAKAAGEFDVRTHAAWAGYAIPNGFWLAGDFSGDGKTDMLHVVNASDYVHTWRSNGNGSFAIGTFRPWRGYAMPNGVWLTADFTGDGKDDFIHVVQGADYVHPWISRGDGTFDVRTFRPWAGYGMPNGVWLVADLNNDRRKDLVHVVAGSDYVHTWTSNGDGTFRVATFRPWSGYAMPNGEWLVGDLDGNGTDDLVHAVRGTDYVHTWMSRGDGTFNVGTFRPWAGYAIPNGLWRVGDFNGDNRADILHVVQGTDYVHTWLSRGNGTFEVGTFRPWAGYAMPNGVWLVNDLNHDGKDDILHAVNATDYAHVWRSTGPHTFAVSTFSPWRGYAIPNGLWLTGDADGNGKADIYHIVANSNYVHPWLSVMPEPATFSVASIEVNQAIQDNNHTVPLIANKATVARAFLDLNATASLTVRGEAVIRNLTTGATVNVASLNTATVNPAENGNLRIKREDLSRGLNFQVPSSLLGAGQLGVRITSLTNGATGATIPCSNCTTMERTVALVNSAPLRVKVIGLRYSLSSTTHSPRALDFNLLRSWLTRAYPVPSVNMTQITIDGTATVPFGCGDANAQLAAIRTREVGNDSVDARTHYYGLVPDAGFFMRGCAAGIPGLPSPETVASGPTGSGTFGWDNDGSYGDWYGGHELGHTFGRFHLGSGCGESSDDPGYPYPSGQISSNDGRFVGLDLGDSANGIATAVLPGTTWRDVMTYCTNQWISDYTYTRIRDRLNLEDALPGGVPIPVAGASPETSLAVADGAVEPDMAGPPVIDEGETQNQQQIASASEYITPSYAQPELPPPAALEAPVQPGDYAYKTAPDIQPERDLQMEAGAMPPQATTITQADPLVQPKLPQSRGSVMISGDLIHVVATVNLTKKTGNITYVGPVKKGMERVGEADDTVQLRLLDSAGSVVGVTNSFVLIDSEQNVDLGITGIIDQLVKKPPELSAIELMIGGVSAARFELPVQSQAESLGGGGQIQAILSDDRRLLDVSLPLSGPGPSGITYTIEISTDGGTVWQTIGISMKEPRTVIDIASLGVETKNLMVRVIANTGINEVTLGTKDVRIE